MTIDLLSNIARRLNLKAGRPDLPALLFMTDEKRTPDPIPVLGGLPAGSGVIYRHYELADRQPLGRRIRDICRQRGLILLVAADLDLARELDADGMHLPGWRLGGHQAPLRRWLAARGRLLTVAVHNRRDLVRARKLPLDAAILSPIFPTTSHPDRPPIALPVLRRLIRCGRTPLYGLGGIDGGNGGRLLSTGLAGIAGIGGFLPHDARRQGQDPGRLDTV